MHFICLVFTKEYPTEFIISGIMDNYLVQNTMESCEKNKFSCDYYEVGGRFVSRLHVMRNGDNIHCDSAKVNEVVNQEYIKCSCFIDANGTSYAAETWNGHDFVVNEHFDEELENAWNESGQYYVTVLNCHE